MHLGRTRNFPLANISYPKEMLETVRNVSFSENFAYVLNE